MYNYTILTRREFPLLLVSGKISARRIFMEVVEVREIVPDDKIQKSVYM